MKLSDDTGPSASSSEDDSLKELLDEALENSEPQNGSEPNSQSKQESGIETKSNQTEPRRKWFDIIRVF